MLAFSLILAASLLPADRPLVKPVDPKVFAELRPRMSIIELVDKQEPWWFDRAW
jgi:hypothetical protein